MGIRQAAAGQQGTGPLRRFGRTASGRVATVAAALVALVATAVVVPTAPQAQAATRPTVAVVGDSYTWGMGATNPATEAWWRTTARELGWTPGTIVDDIGGGYVAKGVHGTFVQALKAHPLSPSTTYVLVEGGFNDRAESPTAVATGVRATLSLVRSQAPRATIVVVGAFLPDPAKVTGRQVQVAQAIGTAVGSTRYLTGFLASFGLAADRVHPSTTGHRTLGHFVATRISHGLDNAPPFHKDPTGTFYIA